eukprot:CAMPEP_0184686552 /NCGR_PEP_ID=MMETSP0312-20130426/22942_1 /TAXON_ID=31354 /ORGANISM="Compsopogon coeruleus, Strain SAG 36.94" /LENGTH=227 /DNA_ID=CAMNT_0027141757 /DNA_START=1 /DNA_END=684 /DNA_ORIENTATION=+
MSTWKNAVPRREHRERAQPQQRQRLGLLEKHKDYRRRAQDFHAKEKRLRLLRERAALRNPDEFYYGMEHTSRTRPLRNEESRQSGPRTAEQALLARSRDAAYLAMKAATERCKAVRIRERRSAVLAVQAHRTHVRFADSDDELDVGVEEDHSESKMTPARGNIRPSTAATRDLAELEQRELRERTMRSLIAQLDMERLVMGRGRKRRIQPARGEQPAVYRWKKQRAR